MKKYTTLKKKYKCELENVVPDHKISDGHQVAYEDTCSYRDVNSIISRAMHAGKDIH